MRPIAPRLGDSQHIEELTVAEEQEQFCTLTMARVAHDGGGHSMFARWTFTPEERARIAAGADVYLSSPERAFPHNLSLRPEWAEPESTNG